MITRNKTISRADIVRERRNRQQRSRTRRVSRRDFKTATREMPSIMVRENGASIRDRSRKKGNPRRRYDISVGTDGAEIRLPALPAIHLGWRSMSLIMLTVLISLLMVFWTSPKYKIQEIVVVGNERYADIELATVLNAVGMSIFQFDPQSALETMKTVYPELKDVDLRVALPAKITLTVVERRPVIEWRYGEKVIWIDSDGHAIMPKGEAAELVIVEARGIPTVLQLSESGPSQWISPEQVEAILMMSIQAPEETPVLYDPELGLGWVDPGGWQVFFGMNPGDMSERLAVYRSIVDYLAQQRVQPKLINVEFLHAPYYRVEP